ncbi:polysaccharide biosynthesis protein [Geothrix oryzisoli]|uniref:polysaccharide biosynthesis protein n=1 Tax=Geothrix oryzisoli TaxID=2922721 RepID=UPI001FAE73E0|nr:nucleoside-diphosphate sugar epimerase/dehydratase [Geothrix oryzisoli]
MHHDHEPIQTRATARIRQALRLPNVRQAVKVLLDAGFAALAWVVAYSLDNLLFPQPVSILQWIAFAMAVNLAFQHTRRLYRLTGFEEVRSFLISLLVMVVVVVGYFGLEGFVPWKIEPPSITLTASSVTVLLWILLRAAVVAYFHRQFARTHRPRPTVCRRKVPRPGQSLATDLAQRTLIVGAGMAGSQLCQELRTNPDLRCHVVGFVDDALEKQGIRIQGFPVLGHSKLLPIIIKETRATQVILAIPSAPGARIRELANTLHAEGVRVKTLPSMESLLVGQAWKPEIRNIAIEDLLRREPVTLSLGAIRQELEGSVVLITGAGGSIGSELARQVANFHPSTLVLLGRGENSLWEIERELRRLFPAQRIEVELCDIRNPTRLHQAFGTWHPRSVFHAAAHKHVPYLEKHPEEGIENNVFGTLNVLNAATAVGTKNFVNVSTDKAVNPTSVLGVTKRLAEFLVLRAAQEERAECRFVSVRFGNVLGSRGSVIPLFRDQIRNGGPITVTHPDMTRYFMTIPEASQLVLQAGMHGHTGKIFVLDMGEPVRIVDLATDMARLSGLKPGLDIDIEFTGVRPGEKLYEELFTNQEQSRSDVHAKVFEAVMAKVDRDSLEHGLEAMRRAIDLPDGLRQRTIVQRFMELVPSYRPSPSGLGKHLKEPLPSGQETASAEVHPPAIPLLKSPLPLTQLEA